jgi:hypothetical protein
VTELLRVPLGRDGDLVKVRASVRQAGAMLGLTGQDQTRLATASAEVARSTGAAGGGTMRLSVEPEQGTAGLLTVEFTPATPGRPLDAHEEIGVLERLLDRFDLGADRWSLGKRLPADEPLSAARLDAVAQALAHDTDVDPVVVLHEQNSELASTLVQLRSRESELVRLNEELAQTNRGVLALYSELERSAEQVRIAQRLVFTELEDALRPPPPSLPGVELAIRYLPAQTNSPTGGDLYDWLVLPDGWLHISVVDVVGHGVASTRTALDVTHALRTLSREGHPLGDLVALADSLLAGTGSLATVLLVRLHPGTGDVEIAAGPAGAGGRAGRLPGGEGTPDRLPRGREPRRHPVPARARGHAGALHRRHDRGGVGHRRGPRDTAHGRAQVARTPAGRRPGGDARHRPRRGDPARRRPPARRAQHRPLTHRESNRVTRSGWAENGLAHSDGVPVIGWASVTTTNGVPG